MATNTKWAERVKSDLIKNEPVNRVYVFAKTCTNDHGTFAKGEKARGAFSADLVKSYVECGILAPVNDDNDD